MVREVFYGSTSAPHSGGSVGDTVLKLLICRRNAVSRELFALRNLNTVSMLHLHVLSTSTYIPGGRASK